MGSNLHHIEGDVAFIKLVRKKHIIRYAKVDIEDLDKVVSHRYTGHLNMQNTVLNKQDEYNAKYYARATLGVENGSKIGILMHRFVLGANKDWDCAVVDHINGDTLDNRKSNLRITNQSINSLNRSRINYNNKVKIPGVYWVEREKCYYIYSSGTVRKYLGRAKTLEEAALIRNAWDA